MRDNNQRRRRRQAAAALLLLRAAASTANSPPPARRLQQQIRRAGQQRTAAPRQHSCSAPASPSSTPPRRTAGQQLQQLQAAAASDASSSDEPDRLEKNFKDLDEFYEELIEQHLNPNRPKSMEGDILDLLLQLKKDELTPIDLTLEDIKAIIMNVLLAGSDTSAAAVIWAMTALMKNPKSMKKVQEEIRKSVGKKGDILNEDDIQNMPYFKAVIKESFRLYPSVPLLVPRESMEKSTLEGYEIQAGTIIHVNSWAIARDPEIWENPEEFIPERFLNSDVDFKGQDFELIPFGAGRRGCPGMALGVASMELALSNLLYAFDWELPSGMKKEDINTDVKPGITMHKKNDLCLLPKNYL